MTRFEAIAAHLRVSGPLTVKEISEAFNWPENSTSAVVSQARTYGFIEVHSRRASGRAGCPRFTWRYRAKAPTQGATP